MDCDIPTNTDVTTLLDRLSLSVESKFCISNNQLTYDNIFIEYEKNNINIKKDKTLYNQFLITIIPNRVICDGNIIDNIKYIHVTIYRKMLDTYFSLLMYTEYHTCIGVHYFVNTNNKKEIDKYINMYCSDIILSKVSYYISPRQDQDTDSYPHRHYPISNTSNTSNASNPFDSSHILPKSPFYDLI